MVYFGWRAGNNTSPKYRKLINYFLSFSLEKYLDNFQYLGGSNSHPILPQTMLYLYTKYISFKTTFQKYKKLKLNQCCSFVCWLAQLFVIAFSLHFPLIITRLMPEGFSFRLFVILILILIFFGKKSLFYIILFIQSHIKYCCFCVIQGLECQLWETQILFNN